MSAACPELTSVVEELASPSAITVVTVKRSSRVTDRKNRSCSHRRQHLFSVFVTMMATLLQPTPFVLAWTWTSAISRSHKVVNAPVLTGRQKKVLSLQLIHSMKPLAFVASSSSIVDPPPRVRSRSINLKSGKIRSPSSIKSKRPKIKEKMNRHELNQLSQTFDDSARREGFDSSTAYFAPDSTFLKDDDKEKNNTPIPIDNYYNEDSNDSVLKPNTHAYDDSMESRIAAAFSEWNGGRVSVPRQLDQMANSHSLEHLGFRPEVNPFGNDETPRRQPSATLLESPLICPACGSKFQCDDEARPGFLPNQKFDIQVMLSKWNDNRKVEVDDAEWSAESEVKWMLQNTTKSTISSDHSSQHPSNASTNPEMKTPETDTDLLDFEELSLKRVICKRCHGLQNFGFIDKALRPGWTSEPTLSQERFRNLLRPLRKKRAVIIALIDLFDFAGSVLPELDNIAGNNPVILAANKVDLLPKQMGPTRVESWVRRELEYLGIKSLANIGGAVRLISCKTGHGVEAMMEKARDLAKEMDCDIYVVGAANAGKSTLLNIILASSVDPTARADKRRPGNASRYKGLITTSPLPGTTLEFIKVKLNDGRSLYDTPGLLVPGTLTQILTSEELKVVVPRKKVEPVTFRLTAGKCVLVGGLARIELLDSKPFLFTFFVANDIKLHPTDADRANEVIRKHVGTMITPPFSEEGLERFGRLKEHVIDVEGMGWKEAAADVSLTGLGWVTVMGAGHARIKVSVPQGVGVSLRPPLMPYDVWETTASYTGARAVRKSTKLASGKRRKGVGRN